MVAAPSLDVYTDDNPTPRITVTFASLAAGAEFITVYRYVDQYYYVVPGGYQLASLGGAVITDYYAPLGAPTTYRAEMFDASGESLGFTDSATATIPADGSVYVQSPSDPTLFAKVELRDTAGQDLLSPVTGQTFNIGGRRILIAEANQLLSNLDMSFFTDTLDQYQKVLKVVQNDYGLICYRTPPPLMVPRVLYAWGAPHRQEFNLPGGFEDFEWENQVDQVSPPASNIIASPITYYPYTISWPTYGQFSAAYVSYLDAERNPPAEIDPTNPTPATDVGFITDGGVVLLS